MLWTLRQLGREVVPTYLAAILMREHGIRRVTTRDTDFHRFSFLEAIDPLA